MIRGKKTEARHNMSHAEKRKVFYNDKLKVHGGKSVKAVGWDNEHKAIQRYSLVGYELAELGVKSVLDYGCGLCHLKPFIPINTQYHGYDTNTKYIEAVREQDVSPRIYATDWLGEWPFEAVAIVGTWSVRNKDESDEEFMQEVINNLMLIKHKIKPKYVVITALWSDACDNYDPKLFYFKGRHLNQIEEETKATFVKLKSILGHENILIFKW